MEEYSSKYVSIMKQANDQGQIYIFGGFDLEMGNYSTEQVKFAIEGAQRLNKNYVVCVFDSSGGLVSTLQRYLGAMQLYKPTNFYFVGVVVGQAYSAACDLLQYMDWRVAHSHATLLVHYGTTGLNNYDQGQLYQNPDVALSFEKSRNNAFLEMYSKRTGKMTKAQVHSLCMQNASITSYQALEFGLVDEIIDNLPTQSFRPDYLLL